MTQEQKALFEKDPLIKTILEAEGISTIKLVGGAVIDILEGRTPKDYDFTLNYFPNQEKFDMEYLYETKTAKTFKKGEFIIQALKTDTSNFDFTISAASLTINYKKEMLLTLDETSFKKKILIPCDLAWTERKNALNSLKRIPHWRKKGYDIADETYMSLLNVLGKNGGKNS